MTPFTENKLVEVKNLNLSINKVVILKNISLSIYHNEIISIVGESGSGKSITALSLMGLQPENAFISSDKINFCNKPIYKLSSKEWQSIRGKSIGMIFQEPQSSLNPSMRCGKQLIEVLNTHNEISKQENKKTVLLSLKEVKLEEVNRIYNSYPHELSGGQKQRVMIAMALLCKPKLLIADEPTTALDVTVQKEIILLLKHLQKKFKMSILFISHDLSLVKRLAERIFVMHQGAIIESGTSKSIFSNPKKNYTKGLLFARPSMTERLKALPTIDDYSNRNYKPERVSSEQRVKKHNLLYSQKPILEVVNVQKIYFEKFRLFSKTKDFTAIKSISFNLYPGETLGLVGESGCGKSTLGKGLIFIDHPTSGNIFFNEKKINPRNNKEINFIRKKIQLIFQDPYAAMHPTKTVGNSIMEVLLFHKILSTKKSGKIRAVSLLDKVGLSVDYFNRYPHELSGGQRQRVIIARALAMEPEILICDECVSALDLSVQAKILNLLNSLKEEFQLSFIFISHDLSVVKYMSDRIIVMEKGKLVESQEADSLYINPKEKYTKKLISSLI
jgi:peptide/nickel transport system ATP-binding protein